MRSSAAFGPIGLAYACLAVALFAHSAAHAAAETSQENIQLELSPRICTLTGNDKQCDTLVRATWQAPHNEDLCLVIEKRSDIKRCWESYSQGTYSVELMFSTDLVFQLKDIKLQSVLASEVLRVIREALQYRHRRREPWNIFG
jgi:hypothetical protein